MLAAALLTLLAGAVSSFAPGLAATLVQSSLADAGVQGTNTQVVVTTDPPVEVLQGHADRITITSEQATIGDLRADRLALDLIDVDLGTQAFEQVEGRLTDVDLPTASGSRIRAEQVDLAGPANAARATVRIGGAAVEQLALETIERETGLSIGAVTLVEPDRAVFSVLGIGVGGRFTIEPDGGLGMALDIFGNPQLSLVSGGPMRIESVAVVGGDLVLTGTIDVAGLLTE